MRSPTSVVVGLAFLFSCGGAPSSDAHTAATVAASTEGSAPKMKSEPSRAAASDLSDKAPVAFRADFSTPELGRPWNIFGAQNGNRELRGGPDGLWIKIADAEKAWDA